MRTELLLTRAAAAAVIVAACASPTPGATTAPPATVAATTPAVAPTQPTTTTVSTTTTEAPPPTVEPNGEVVQVAIDGFAFKPAEVTVTPGTTIVWTNLDGVGHTATAEGGAFRTGTLGPDATHEIVLGEPGTYDYFCSIHTDMRATITVEG